MKASPSGIDDDLGEVVVGLAHVDVGPAVVVEHPEVAVHPQVHRRGLQQRLVERVDDEAPGGELLADGAIGEDHRSESVPVRYRDGMVGERGFRVDEIPGGPTRAEVAAARAEGWIPDVVLGGELVGDGPAEGLDLVDVAPAELAQLCDRRRLPRWVIAKNPLSGGFVSTKALMRTSELVTVCEEAACPNIGQCWSRGTATFMIAGDTCTRGCRFCNIATGRPGRPPDPQEPARIAEAAAAMGLRFVVVTAVARDDLPDGGAAHFAACIAALRERLPECRVEVLIPDLRGSWEALEAIIEAAPDVLNHNTETVPRLYSRVRPGARYERTLELLVAQRRRRADHQERHHGRPRRVARRDRGRSSPTSPRWAAGRSPWASTCGPRRPICRWSGSTPRPSTRRSRPWAATSVSRTSNRVPWCAPRSRPTGSRRPRSPTPDAVSAQTLRASQVHLPGVDTRAIW